MGAELERDVQAAGIIPFRVRVGVTGHRQISGDPELEEQVRRALARIRELARGRTPTRLAVVSPLAEGADQLVAAVALEWDPEASLEVLLPAPEAEYVRRFEQEESRAMFRELAARASSVVPLEPAPETPEEAYEQVGRQVVDSSDVVIALWDGQPARGPAGTANVVAYARQRRVPLIWIETRPPFATREELCGGLVTGSFRELDHYNTAKAPMSALHLRTKQRMAGLLGFGEVAGLDGSSLSRFCEWILPYYTRADALADRWQTRYRRFSNTLFFAAAGAVIAVTAQVLFAPEQPRLVGIEIALLVMVLATLVLGRRLRVHERWISCRVLAERFRSALFLALLGTEPQLENLSEHAGLDSTGQWARRAFDEVWRSRPKAAPPSSVTDALKSFVTAALIDDQLRYHNRATEAHHRRQTRLTRASYLLFGTTLVAASLHAADIGGSDSGGGFTLANTLTLLAVALPAIAGALASVQAQRQYPRSLERSKAMAHRLHIAREEMLKAPDLESVQAVARETENILLQESNDWLVTVHFQGIKLSV